jgi:hypothetical protein
MKKYTSPLDHVNVAAPCPADWDEMIGNDVKRFCGQCELNVYNLSGMTREEAEALIINAEGRLCIRFYRRVDGTILTNNCPVGLRALKGRVSRLRRATASAVLSFFAGLGIYTAFDKKEPVVMMGTKAAPSTIESITETPPTFNTMPSEGWLNGQMISRPVGGRIRVSPAAFPNGAGRSRR